MVALSGVVVSGVGEVVPELPSVMLNMQNLIVKIMLSMELPLHMVQTCHEVSIDIISKNTFSWNRI